MSFTDGKKIFNHLSPGGIRCAAGKDKGCAALASRRQIYCGHAVQDGGGTALDSAEEIAIFNRKDEFYANGEKTVEKIGQRNIM